MHYNVYQLLMLFLIYSFLGWCVEVSFVAVTTGRVVNRGFLNGPVCPIYGVGMLGPCCCWNRFPAIWCCCFFWVCCCAPWWS